MTLFSQILWGALFTKIIGYSFFSVRASTLLLSFIGCTFIYFICLILSKSRRKSFACALLTLFSPLFFSISFSFMTDVPAMVFGLGAIYYYIQLLSNDLLDKNNFVLGVFLSILSVMTRQLYLCIPLGFFITFLLSRQINKKILLYLFYLLSFVLLF